VNKIKIKPFFLSVFAARQSDACREQGGGGGGDGDDDDIIIIIIFM
jgi:hypothetical protein